MKKYFRKGTAINMPSTKDETWEVIINLTITVSIIKEIAMEFNHAYDAQSDHHHKFYTKTWFQE